MALSLNPQAILGIDPGFSGAMAVLTGYNLDIYDLPLKKVNGKTEIDEKEFSNIIATLAHKVSFAAIEDVHAFPGQGVSSTFRFGFNTGKLIGVLAASGIEILRVKPSVWKSALGLGRDKKASIAHARHLFMMHQNYFQSRKHDGRAEAALIAYYAQDAFISTYRGR